MLLIDVVKQFLRTLVWGLLIISLLVVCSEGIMPSRRSSSLQSKSTCRYSNGRTYASQSRFAGHSTESTISSSACCESTALSAHRSDLDDVESKLGDYQPREFTLRGMTYCDAMQCPLPSVELFKGSEITLTSELQLQISAFHRLQSS